MVKHWNFFVSMAQRATSLPYLVLERSLCLCWPQPTRNESKLQIIAAYFVVLFRAGPSVRRAIPKKCAGPLLVQYFSKHILVVQQKQHE